MNKQNWILFAAISIIGIYFIWFSWPIVWSNSNNYRLVLAYDTDEATHVEMIKEALLKKTMFFDFGFYGHLYFYLTLIPLFFIGHFVSISEQMIIVTLRLIPVAFGAATVLLSFLLAKRYIGNLEAWAVLFFLSFVPLNFMHMSTLSHPDVPQLFFIMLSLYFCCRMAEERRKKYLFLASTSAGLAFACKYSGLFVIPIIYLFLFLDIRLNGPTLKEGDYAPLNIKRFRFALASLGVIFMGAGILASAELVERMTGIGLDKTTFDVHKLSLLNKLRMIVVAAGVSGIVCAMTKAIWQFVQKEKWLNILINNALIVLVIFFCTFLIISPFSFYKLNFLKGMLYESAHTSFGHSIRVSESGATWFNILSSPPLFDRFVIVILFMGFLAWLAEIVKKGVGRIITPIGLIWIWATFFLVFLIFRVNLRPPRYILPIIPALAILFVDTVKRYMGLVKKHINERAFIASCVIAFIAIVCIEMPTAYENLTNHRERIRNWEKNSPSVRAGKWLEEKNIPNVKIMADYFSYIPPNYRDVVFTWGGTLEAVRRVKPDIIVVHKRVWGQFEDMTLADKYAWGREEYLEKYNYYSDVLGNRSEFNVMNDFDECKIYSKVVP